MAKASVVGARDGKTLAFALLSYLGLLCFIPLLSNRDDEFIAFHAKQGLVLWLWAMVALLGVVVPGIGQTFFQISLLAIPVFSVAGLISVALGKRWTLPLVHALTKRF